MRVLAMLSAAAVLVTAGVVASGPAGATTLPATARVVVRPVTSAGRPAQGFTVTNEQGSVDCHLALPSPGSVSPNIDYCGPSAEYAIACWKAGLAGHVLCMRNPRVKQVTRLKRTGTFDNTGRTPAALKAPLNFDTLNGQKCTIRDGGSGAILKTHPKWVITYYCANNRAVWMPRGAQHLGIYETSPSWTVHIGSAAGTGPVVLRHVSRAWFVGTAAA